MKKFATLFLVGLMSISISLHSQIFIEHDPDESSFGNYITQIAIDGDKVVCASRGDSILCVYDGETWTRYGRNTYGFAPDISSQRELIVDNEGDYWVAHRSEIDQFDGTTVTNFNTSNSDLAHNNMLDIAVDNDGRMFFCYSNGYGISILEDGVWTHDGEFTDGLAPLNNIFLPYLIELDPLKNELWLFYGGTFYQIIGDNIVIHDYENPNIPLLGSEEVKAMTVTEDGNVWFAITDFNNEVGGLLMYDGLDWTHLTAENDGLPDVNISSLSSYGNQLIIGGFDTKKVSVLDNGEWITYDHTNSNFPEWGGPTLYEMRTLGDKVFIGTSRGVFEMNLNPAAVGIGNVSQLGITLYPNPTLQDGKVSLNLKKRYQDMTIHLFDNMGRLLKIQKEQGVSQTDFVIEGLDGIYFLELKLDNESPLFFRVLKK